MSEIVQIYVSLLDEKVEVWRPVQAEHLHGDLYRIVSQSYDQAIETWQFKPGDKVICQMIKSNDGLILAATRRVERD
jgi:hypothetical protein